MEKITFILVWNVLKTAVHCHNVLGVLLRNCPTFTFPCHCSVDK